MTERERLMQEVSGLIGKMSRRSELTIEELQELRIDLSIVSAKLVVQVFEPVSREKVSAELAMDDLEGRLFKDYFELFMQRRPTDPNGEVLLDSKGKPRSTFSASMSETLARRALHAEGTPFYEAKQRFLYAKSEEAKLYQVLKAIQGLTNSLSVISKT